MSQRPLNVRLWFAVLGGPLAWAIVHIAGVGFGLARCESPNGRFQVSVHGWSVALAAAGIAVAIAAELMAIRLYRATREAESKPPGGRVHFLSIVAMTVNPLALAIMLEVGIGVPLLKTCVQS